MTVEERMIELLLESGMVSKEDMDACRVVAMYDLANEADAADLPKPLPKGRKHGTMYAYVHHGCRCRACQEAQHENYIRQKASA